MFASDIMQPDDELTKYVIDHYQKLCTPSEDLALRILNLNLKAEHTQNPTLQRKLAEFRGLKHNAEVQGIVAQGPIAARRKISERLLRDQGDVIFLNYCPKCSALCRTPLAKMCVRCGHSWYDQPVGMIG